MQTSPPVTEIKKWLHRHNPLGCFATEDFEITDIDPRAWSGHFNYLITTRDKRFVLRSKGPEWGESTQGIFDEYRILKALEPYDIAPKVFYLSEDFFGEGMLFQEYMEGTIITTLPRNERLSAMMDAVRYIASINITPVTPGELPHGELLTSYAPSKREWRERIDYAMKHPPTHALAERIATLLPKAESMLDQFEDHLTHVLAQIHPAFVFISSHAGHCLKRASDYRFFNWEQVSFGDPSYSLAVFLASIKNEPDF